MAASETDVFCKVGEPGTATTMTAPGHTTGGTSISVVSTANYPTDTGVIFAIDTVSIVDGKEVRDVGSYTEWEGTVGGATTLENMVLRYGDDQNYPAGATTRVYIPVSSSRENRLVDGLLVSHDQDGTLKAGAVDNAKLADGAVTAEKIGTNAVDNTKLSTTAGDIGGAWKAYTPTVASTVGRITTYTSSGYYTQIGKTIIGSGKFAITNNGTGSGAINVSVPVNNVRSNGAGVIHGKEINITGKAIVGQFTGTNSTYLVFGSDNSYPGGTGANVIEFSFTYEAA